MARPPPKSSTLPMCVACLSKIGWGIKRICRQTGFAKTTVHRFMRVHQATDPFLAAVKQQTFCDAKKARTARAKAERKAKRAAERATKPKAKQMTQMERYYANHEQSKAYAAAQSRKRWLKLSKGSDEYMRKILRARISHCIKRDGGEKYASTVELIGCSIGQFKAHMELLFIDGMSWDNYGDWEVDHRKPCASFDLSVPEQQRACFHYTNLQPLWRTDNRSKHARIAA